MADYDNPRPSSQPVGSTEPAVVKDNFITVDIITTSTETEITNRKGGVRKTLLGLEVDAQNALRLGAGDPQGDYVGGVSQYDKSNWTFTYSGQQWGLSGDFDLSTLPYLTTEADPNNDANLAVRGSASQEYVQTEVTRGQGENVGGKIFPTDDDVLANGMTVPVGTTHLRVLVGSEPVILAAWDALTLPATVTSVPLSDNGASGYDVVTDQGTFEFVTLSNYEYRKNYDLRAFGISGSDGEDLGQAIQKAVTFGWSKAYVPNVLWTATGGVDANGMILIGHGRMTGGTLTNFKLEGISNRKDKSVIERKEPCKQLSGPSTNKLLFKRSNTAFSLFSRNATNNEYIYTEIEQSSDSVPALSVGSPFELMRAQQRWRCNEVIVYRKNYDNNPTGTVTVLNQNLDAYFSSTAGATRIDALNSNANPINAWQMSDGAEIEYLFDSFRFNPDVFEMSLTAYVTSGSSTNVEIEVNGSVVKTFSAVADPLGSSIRTIKFPVDARGTGQTVSVLIRNADGGARNFYPIGLNVSRLRDDDSDIYQPDYFVAWYLTATAYCDTNGAGDYAFQDADSGLFAGSYHGGETSTYLRMIVGTNKTDPTLLPVNYFGIAKNIGVAQRTTISGGVGGGTINTVSNLNYVVDGVESLKVEFNGSANVSTAYTMLFPAADAFTSILYPGDVSLPVSETTQALTDDAGDVVQLDNNSSLYVRHTFTTFNNSRNSFGGPHVWNRVGTYRKVYYGPIVNNLASLNNLSFEYNREFGKGKY